MLYLVGFDSCLRRHSSPHAPQPTSLYVVVGSHSHRIFSEKNAVTLRFGHPEGCRRFGTSQHENCPPDIFPAGSGGPSRPLPEPFFLTTEVSEIIKFKEPKPWDDSSFLTHLYVKKQWSLRRISKELGCHKSVVRKKLKQTGIDDFEFVVEQDKLLVKKIESMRQQRMSYQRVADLLNLWRIGTRSGSGRWYAMTVREVVK